MIGYNKWIIAAVAFLATGCVHNTINMSSGPGTHELGPEDDTTNQENQSSTDSISELSSKISGIDRSENTTEKTLGKTSTTQQKRH